MNTDTVLRLIQETDAGDLAQILRRSREHLAPWEPERAASYFTEAGQRELAGRMLAEQALGRSWPGVICAYGELVGRITLNNILRGPLQSCFVSYWVAADFVRKGIGTRALQLALDTAFNELALHRVEAFTQVSNKPSRLVLERNNFRHVGVLRRHIHIAGGWRDEFLFERIAPWDDGVRASPSIMSLLR